MATLKPAKNTVVLKRATGEAKSQSGIILASTPIDNANVGEVVAIGPSSTSLGVDEEDTIFAVGDRVVLARGTGQVQKLDGVEYILAQHSDILAVVQ